jgi:hypothetical protein
MSSDLTGKFIANTYQKLLQVDNDNGSNGNTANFVAGGGVASTENYDLLNGSGEKVPYMVVNHEGNGDGGFFIKNGSTNSDVMGIQFKTFNNSKGLNFWTPLESNANLFLKNTGSLWVGYKNSTSDITTDTSGYNLYVKDGIRVGNSDPVFTDSHFQMLGENVLIMANYTTNFNFFLNFEHPFKTLRYKYRANFDDDRIRTITDIDNTTKFSTTEYSAHITGFYLNNAGAERKSGQIVTCMMVDNGSSEWAVKFNNYSSGSENKTIIFDVLLIKKGFYSDDRDIDEDNVNEGGDNLNPLTPL